MATIGGIGWALAPSLKAYVAEADAAYPGRDHASDGSIGDQAHAARQSDHNPYEGWVHAVDLDEDLAPGLDLKDFAERLRRRRDPRVAYVIYEGRAFYSWARNGYAAWAWQPYGGPNAHLHHLHLSILRTPEARNDLSPWGFVVRPAPTPQPHPQEDDDVTKPIFYDDPASDHPGTYVLFPDVGKVAQLVNAADVAELRKAIADPGHTAKLSEKGADQLRRVFIS